MRRVAQLGVLVTLFVLATGFSTVLAQSGGSQIPSYNDWLVSGQDVYTNQKVSIGTSSSATILDAAGAITANGGHMSGGHYPLCMSDVPIPELVDCTRQDVAPNGIPHNATKQLNLTVYSQLSDIPAINNVFCGPASGASILDYISRTMVPGLIDGYSIKTLIGNLSVLMGINENGTSADNVLFGLMRFLNQSRLLTNFTYTYYDWDYLTKRNGSSYPPGYQSKISFRSTPGLVFTWENDNATYRNIRTEFIRDDGLIILAYKLNYTREGHIYQHGMALDNLNTKRNRNGHFNISFMAPWQAATIYGEIDRDGTVHFPQDDVVATPLAMIVVSEN